MQSEARLEPPSATSPWITSFCVVKFDLEYGHTLEDCHPKIALPPEEEKNISFLSFPDCNTNSSSDSLFTFRTRKGELRRREFHYGYVYFRQQKDETSSRGYLQKSIVLLSPLLHAHFFKRVIKLVGFLYFKHGPSVLSTAFRDILAWPKPEAGKSYELPLLDWVLRVRLAGPLTSGASSSSSSSSSTTPSPSSSLSVPSSVPSSASSPAGSPTSSAFSTSPPRPSPPLTLPTSSCLESQKGYSHEGAELFKGLGCALSHLWHLWELVLLNEPLVVEATDPSLTSDAVLSLIHLISPLEYGSDFRPYFTIYDRDYNEYAKAHPECLPGAIIGVTNPHFSHVLGHWPHTLRIGGTAPRVLLRKDPPPSSSSSSSPLRDAGSDGSSSSPTGAKTIGSQGMRDRSYSVAVTDASGRNVGRNGVNVGYNGGGKGGWGASIGKEGRSYSDPALIDDFREDDSSYEDIPVDSESESESEDNDNSSNIVDRNRNRNGSAAINISAAGNASNNGNAASKNGSGGGSGGGSYSFGGTKGVFEVLREKMSLRPNRERGAAGAGRGASSPDAKSLGGAGRLSRTRSNSSGHLPGGSSPPGRPHPRPQRPATSLDSKMRPLIVVNKKVLKQLLVPNRPSAYYNELIRRHFHRLTEVFLQPLELYFGSLVPAASTVSPFKPAPRVAVFNEDHFLRSLCRDDGAYLTGSASGDQQLYKRFLRSQNYYGWLQKRESEATAQLERWYLRAFLSAKVPQILRRKAEIEIVDFYILFQDNMKKMMEEGGAMDTEKVEACSEAILACLPHDLAQSILEQQKARAAHSATGVEEDCGSGGESGDYSD